MPATNITNSYSNFDVADSVSTQNDINNIGGGAGAGLDGNVYIQGDQSISRRINGQTRGFYLGRGANVNLTGAHVKVWVGSVTWPDVVSIDIVIDDGTNRDQYTIPSSLYPPSTGVGFIPIWFDPNVAGNTIDETSVGANGSGIGVEANVGTLSSNLDNILVDSINYGTAGYYLSGGSAPSPSNFEEVATAEQNITTGYRGVLQEINGIYFCYARLLIGSTAYPTLSSTAVYFSEADSTMVFPDQSLVATDWMGITTDLNTSGTVVLFDTVTLQSADVTAATRRPDFVVDGNTGTCSITNCNILGFRNITLTSSCSVNGGVMDALDITQGGAQLENMTINTRSPTTVATINDATFGETTGINNVNFVQVGAGHAIEITSPGTYNFYNIGFSGYGGTPGSNGTENSGANNAAILNSSTGLVTINILNDGDTPSVRNVNTGSTTVVAQSYTLKMTKLHSGTELRIFSQSGLIEQGGGVENVETAGSYGTDFTQVVGENPGADGLYSVNYTYSYTSDLDVYVVAHNTGYLYRRIDQTLSNSNETLQVNQTVDRQYI